MEVPITPECSRLARVILLKRVSAFSASGESARILKADCGEDDQATGTGIGPANGAAPFGEQNLEKREPAEMTLIFIIIANAVLVISNHWMS